MAATLYLAPTLDTALAHALARLNAVKHANPLTPVYWLLPSMEAIQPVRRRLGSTVAVRLFHFYSLGQSVLDRAGRPVHWVNDTAVRRLVHASLAQMLDQGELASFAAVWDFPGFSQALVEWLREMKSQGIPPEEVLNLPQTSGGGRDRQLARFYARYQNFMQSRQLSDSDGLLWLAAEALEQDGALLPQQGLFLTTGFDQFNPLQVRMLRALARCFQDFLIYLPWDASRPEGSLALARLAQTRQILETSLAPQVLALEDASPPPPGLAQVRRRMFEASNGGAAPLSPPEIRLVAAPSREAEVRLALKAIKQLLLRGIAPSEIALLAPAPPVYARLVETISDEYGVPVQFDRSLLANPAIGALVNLLSLMPDFSWRPTLEALRSPYLDQRWLSLEQVDQLERLSRERPVIAGRDQWRFALQPLLSPDGGPTNAGEALPAADDDLGPPALARLLEPAALQAIERGLEAFFNHLTPPVVGTYRDYTLWLQTAILGMDLPDEEEAGEPAEESPSLYLLPCCHTGPFAGRDVAALEACLSALRSLVEAAEMAPATPDGVISWETYRREVMNTLASVRLPPDPTQLLVPFAALEAGRWQVVDHLLVIGLAEGEFPRQPAPDIFYAPAERLSHSLPLIRPSPAEDASRWWQVLSNCRRSLALFHPRLDERGASWLPSPYWQTVRDLFPGLPVEEPPVAAIPTLEAAAGTAELFSALAQQAGPSLEAAIPAGLRSKWQAASYAFQSLAARQDWQPAPAYEGCLEAPDLRLHLAQRYGRAHVWSASQLSRYAACPFSFLAQAGLGLEARPDPVEGLDVMQRGQLLHELLEKLYHRLAEEGLAPTPSNQEAVFERLEQACEQVFPHAPPRYGFRPGALWRYEQQEMRRLLRLLIEWECQQNGETPSFLPYCQELRFGIGRDSLPALVISTGDGDSFQLHGVVDRLDRDAQGRLRVIDYKSGKTEYRPEHLERGLALQAALYALASERLLEHTQVVESHYLSIAGRKLSGRLAFPEGAGASQEVQTAVRRATAISRQAQQGNFPTRPAQLPSGRSACESCDFAGLCRVDRHALLKTPDWLAAEDGSVEAP